MILAGNLGFLGFHDFMAPFVPKIISFFPGPRSTLFLLVWILAKLFQENPSPKCCGNPDSRKMSLRGCREL